MAEGENRTSMDLVSLVLKCVSLGLICICLGVGIGGVGGVGIGIGTTAGEWLWAWTISAFLLPLTLMIGARLMNRPIPKQLELAILILGALLFLASGSWIIDTESKKNNNYMALAAMCIITSITMVADVVIVAMKFLRYD